MKNKSFEKLKIIINGNDKQAGLSEVGIYIKVLEKEVKKLKKEVNYCDEQIRILKRKNERLKENQESYYCSDEELNERYKAVYFDYLKQREINQELLYKYKLKKG